MKNANKVYWILILVLSGASVSVIANPRVGKSTIPASASFRDLSGDKIRSDGPGAYLNGNDCVISTVSGNSSFFLRTVSPYCTTSIPRTIMLDFTGGTPGPGFTCNVTDTDDSGLILNACGSNTVADVRILAGSLFQSGSTSVILPFSLRAEFQETDFELDFLNPICDTGSGGTRVLEAGGSSTCSANPTANASAELYQIGEHGRHLRRAVQGHSDRAVVFHVARYR
jgi:hypothetical protein